MNVVGPKSPTCRLCGHRINPQQGRIFIVFQETAKKDGNVQSAAHANCMMEKALFS